MVRFRDRKASIRFQAQKPDKTEDLKKISIGRIERKSYPKLKAWYLIILLFLGMMYFVARGIGMYWNG